MGLDKMGLDEMGINRRENLDYMWANERTRSRFIDRIFAKALWLTERD